MDAVFPLRTYTRRGKQRTYGLSSKKSEGGQLTGITNVTAKKGASVSPKKMRKKKLKSSKTRRSGSQKRKAGNKQRTSKVCQQQNLTFGMFGSDSECRADDLVSEDAPPKKSQTDTRKNSIDLDEIDTETETLPATEMGGQDKVSEWLSAQNGDDSTESSIEIMREEVVTAAERKVKHFRGKFFDNINKVGGSGQPTSTHNISIEDIPIIDSPVMKKTSSALAGLQLSEPQTCQGTEVSTELGTFTTSINPRSSTVREPQTYTRSTDHRSSMITDSQPYPVSTCGSTQGLEPRTSTEFFMQDSLEEKEKSEKTPGKRTSFAVPRSPVKKFRSKHDARKSSLISLPWSSTRLFQTNIDQVDETPELSSIHGDTGHQFVNSDVSTKQQVPLTPEIQIVNKQPVPRLTSTPARKTSTPNNDRYQLVQLELDLSSVSAVHSDEEGLVLQQSEREVLSDDHIDLSKSRIDENFAEPMKTKIIVANKSRSTAKQAKNKDVIESIQDIGTGGLVDGRNMKLVEERNVQQQKSSLIQKTVDKLHVHSNTTSRKTKAMDSLKNYKRQTVDSLMQSSWIAASVKRLSTGSYTSFFSVRNKNPNQTSKSKEYTRDKNLPVCSLSGAFECPRRNSDGVFIFRRHFNTSSRDLLSDLSKDDLWF